MYTFWLILPALLMVTFFSGMGHALAASNKLKIELGSRQGRLSLQIQYLFLQHLVQFRLTMTIGYVLSIIGLIWLELVSSGTFLVNLNSSVLIFLLLHILVITFVIVFIVEVIARTLFRLNS